MIKAIIFDLGGVVLDMKPLLEKAARIFHPSDKDKFWKEINEEAIPLTKGEISLLEFWKIIAKNHKKRISDRKLSKLWVEDYEQLTSLDEDVMKIARSLRNTYKVGIISNTIAEHVRINKKLGRYNFSDVVTLSNEVKMTKDEEEIFFITAKKLGVKPEECLFIDDVEKFVQVAKSVGMKAILYKNPIRLKESLKSFSVIID